METLKDVGGVVGEYVGDGKGEANSSEYLEEIDDHFEVDTPECHLDPIEEQESSPDSSNGHLPLLVLYDCEATGLSINKDHLTDIAAKVFNPYQFHFLLLLSLHLLEQAEPFQLLVMKYNITM